MNRIVKWSLFLFIVLLVGVYLLGPSRIYGSLFSKEFEATVSDIRSFTPDGEQKTETFVIEFRNDDDEIQIATSCEKVWGVIAKGDRVRVRLYPAAAWTESDGSWINAKLLNKRTPQP